MNRQGRVLVAVPVAAVFIMAGTAGAASAADGVPSGPPPSSGVTCVSTTGAKACFQAYGDLVWVKDTKANGEPVVGTIQGQQPTHWYRACYNDRGEAGGWVKCDFDVPEYVEGKLYAVNNPFIGNSNSTTIWTSDPI
jgi:hypothetical protein